MATLHRVFSLRFLKDLFREATEDSVLDGSAALSYYFLFALFPAIIFLLSLLPYLPIDNLHGEVMSLIRDFLPESAAKMIEGTIAEITLSKHGSLISFGAVVTLWAASSGVSAVMQQLNVAYDIKETRPFWKARGTALLLTVVFTFFVIIAFSLVFLGGLANTWLAQNVGYASSWMIAFNVFRFAVLISILLLGFALLYRWGPTVHLPFKWITPGSAIGVSVLLLASFGFKFYVTHFSNYSASYGSLGAVIVLLLCLYITGFVVLMGSEINTLIEAYAKQEASETGKVESA